MGTNHAIPRYSMTPAAMASSQATSPTMVVKNVMYRSSGRPAPPGAIGSSVIVITAA